MDSTTTLTQPGPGLYTAIENLTTKLAEQHIETQNSIAATQDSINDINVSIGKVDVKVSALDKRIDTLESRVVKLEDKPASPNTSNSTIDSMLPIALLLRLFG